jgi:endoglucanase
MKRRDFIKTMSVASAFTLPGFSNRLVSSPYSLPDTNNNDQSLPLWKGFNLLNKFKPDTQAAFDEKDFELIADWGFNFVRIPLSYWCWSSEEDWYSVDEKVLKEIDGAVDLAHQYNLHINLNFHRVPGYCINNPQPLPTNIFEDEEPLKACQFHWKLFAERYRGIPSSQLSFNLINEAPSVEDEKYDRVARRLISTIREADPGRLIIVDGKDVGRTPLMTVTDIPNIIQSGRGYDPMLISHFRATWPGVKVLMDFPEEELSWPLKVNGKVTDKQSVYQACVAPWKSWVKQGGKVHIGEMGCYNKTPHKIAMAWLEDVFSVFREQNWGWSLWNLHGDFGVLDSRRKDVKYENYKGFLLDREMLELLKRS